jgi:hypothetical protein
MRVLLHIETIQPVANPSSTSRSTTASTTLNDPKSPVSPSTSTSTHSPWTPYTPPISFPTNAKLDDAQGIRLGSSVQGSVNGDMSLLEMLDSSAPIRYELKGDVAWGPGSLGPGGEESALAESGWGRWRALAPLPLCA